MQCREINLEAGFLNGDVAVKWLEKELKNARTYKAGTMKIIHGYGSTGKGGKIRGRVRKFLAEKKADGQIQDYIKGEDFSIFDERARYALRICPELSKDRDLQNANHGITIVII